MTRWATHASVVLVSAWPRPAQPPETMASFRCSMARASTASAKPARPTGASRTARSSPTRAKAAISSARRILHGPACPDRVLVDEKANSGIFIRCAPDKIGAKTCYEFNIPDNRPDQTYGTGSIVYIAEVNPMPKAAGKWNTMEAIAKGRQLTIVFNGVKTVDVSNGLWDEGHFTLQYGGGAGEIPQGRGEEALI